MEDKARLDKVYSKMFESNGEESIVSILHSHEEEIREAKIAAGDAKIMANRVRKYCGLEYSPAEGKDGVCIVAEIIDFVAFIKKTWKAALILGICVFLLLFGIAAYGGFSMTTQMKETAKEFRELKEILVK